MKEKKNKNQFDELSSLINERHSVRDFSKAPVPMELLRSACELALHAPSACNRQGNANLYSIGTEKKTYLTNGFQELVDLQKRLINILS